MNQLYHTLREALLPLHGAGEAKAIALLVLEDGFGVSRTDVYADKVRTFSEDERQRFERMLQRLVSGEPVQHVLGTARFCGHSFRVSPAVLIPRPETEELVEAAARALESLSSARETPLRVLDAGTGSGCVACSLKLRFPEADVTAWDVSDEALAVARENAQTLGADVRFLHRDMLQPFAEGDEAFDVVVSNPPYILLREREEMEVVVTDHEPSLALFVPDDAPMLFHHALADFCVSGGLRSGGVLAAEINSALGEMTVACLKEAGLHDITLLQDCFGKDRIVTARR
ncbi:MAG: peptide chain release factor N(5)-glutamine methyltransferase [Alloprevotella sp.]